MKIKVNKSNFLADEHAARYAPPHHDSTIITNTLCNNDFKPTSTKGTVLVAGSLQYFPEADVVSVIDVLSYLGYTRKHLIDLEVTRNINLIPAGMGGINNGIMYWIQRIQQELQLQITSRLKFFAFDDDYWDVSNIPRIHFSPLGVEPTLLKVKWVKGALLANGGGISYAYYARRIEIDRLPSFATDRLPIVFGATDVTTRKKLSESPDCVYLQITQSDHKLNIHINPEITMKTRDVYGNIFLNEFHMMTLKAAITLLEITKKHNDSAINPLEEQTVELFDIQDYDSKYGISNWLGVVPPNVTYSRHNMYQENNND